MKMKIMPEKQENGKYAMVAIGENGEKEYPQEGRLHDTEESVMVDAGIMYRSDVWQSETEEDYILIETE